MLNTSSVVSPRPGARCLLGIGALLLLPATNLFAQDDAAMSGATSSLARQEPGIAAPLSGFAAVSLSGADQPQQAPPPPEPVNPFADRPVCASMFLKADWQLSGKQKACDWIQNGIFSTNAMLGAAWSAGFSQRTDLASERGDGFPTRFGRKFAQNAFKSTGSYLGGQIFHEDPRKAPPYLVRRLAPTPRGFFKRTGRALGNNFISYRCTNDCSKREHIRRVPALSRVVGSLASGFAGELLTYDRPDSTRHALRGAASAYGSTFINALFTEFKPELSAFAGKAFTKIFGVR
jgi:hypothetical protein